MSGCCRTMQQNFLHKWSFLRLTSCPIWVGITPSRLFLSVIWNARECHWQYKEWCWRLWEWVNRWCRTSEEIFLHNHRSARLTSSPIWVGITPVRLLLAVIGKTKNVGNRCGGGCMDDVGPCNESSYKYKDTVGSWVARCKFGSLNSDCYHQSFEIEGNDGWWCGRLWEWMNGQI